MKTPPPLGLIDKLRLWLRKSVNAPVVMLFLVLLLTVQGLAFLGLRSTIEHKVQSDIDTQLELGERLLKRMIAPRELQQSEDPSPLTAQQRWADELRSLTGLHVSLRVRRNAQSPWSTPVSTLPRETHDALQHLGAITVDASTLNLALPDGDYSARAVTVGEPDGPAASVVLMRSVHEAAAAYTLLQWGLLSLTLLSLIVFGVGSHIGTRPVTRALRKLAGAVERLGLGDYDTPISGHSRSDEIGDLAQTFECMRAQVAHRQEEILKVAYWDKLTGLPTRVQFRNALIEALAQAQTDKHSVAVIMLDIDRLQHVNDALGYRFGDLMLQGVGERLCQQGARHGDLVARLGGDEFAVLLSDLDPTNDMEVACAVAHRLHQSVGDVLALENHMVDVSASLGLAVSPLHAIDADALLSRAEVAMYTAKRQGNVPVVYNTALDVASTVNASLLSELAQAIEHRELRLFLQPKLAIETGRVIGAEALIRWQHPQQGLVLPMSFIPFAEQTGFIRTLTMWVFEESARMWRVLNEGGLRIVISINLSSRDLLDVELPKKLEILMVKHIVPAEAFCLEVTESTIMTAPQRTRGTLERLSGLGFRLSIDNFGTGYSSLAHLKRLPVDELKIDKSFVLSMEKDMDDARIVRSTIELAHGLGLSVVAEGVESAQVWNLLRELSCDEAQGFHMGKPMPASEFSQWAHDWAARQVAPALANLPNRNVTLH